MERLLRQRQLLILLPVGIRPSLCAVGFMMLWRFSNYDQTFWRICSIALCLIMVHGCSASNVQHKSLSVYDRVKQRGSICCGYGIYNPGFMKDPNTGKLSGIGVDALERVATQQGLKIDWVEETGWCTMIEGLHTNRYDIFATPIWPSDDRTGCTSSGSMS